MCVLFLFFAQVSPTQAACVDNDGDGYGSPADASCPGGNLLDCDDTDANVHPGANEICDGKDSNCDGFKPSSEADNDGDGYPICAGDCDDANPTRHPGAPEICDGLDNDCNGVIPSNEWDTDGDGVRMCDVPPDCNNYDASIFPGNVEICSDGKDNNCDGSIDEAGCTCPDADGDGHTLASCGGDDCNDNDPSIYPGASESCGDGIDNNCDGKADCADAACASDAGCAACVAGDTDGDGYSTAGGICGPIDCDDTDANVHPGALEICDGKDSNCDGFTPASEADKDGDGSFVCAGDCDDNDATRFPGNTESCDGVDNDCDGLLPQAEQDPDGDHVMLCSTPPDCNNFNASVFPGNVEICGDGLDNNCDGSIDEAGCTCPDADGDGHTLASCGGDDCNDNDPSIHPGVAEICGDGIDNNCDGKADCADMACSTDVACAGCSAGDLDGDGYSTAGGTCGPVDCDDTNSTVFPGALEICDTRDTNCDGFVPASEADTDGDGVPICAGDCDDTNATVFPGATEICDDGVDNDCDGEVDQYDVADCGPPTCATVTTPKDPPHLSQLLNPDGSVHPDDGALRCGKCHNPADFLDNTRYQCQRCHGDPSDTSNPLNGVTKTQYPLPFPYGFGSAPVVKRHSAAVIGDTKYGDWSVDCVVCHNPHQQEQNRKYGTTYGKLIKKDICYTNQVTGTLTLDFIQFTAPTGPGSFADGPPHNENICETCHTRTNHHQNDGTAPGGESHHDGQKCTNCHKHNVGFAPLPDYPEPPHQTDFFKANCTFCHVEDSSGNALVSEPIPSSKCMQCHGTRQPHSSAVSGTGKYSYATECVDCHDPMHSVGNNIKRVRPQVAKSVDPTSVIGFTSETGPGSFSDGAPFKDNICDTCHTLTNHHRADGQAPGDLDSGGNYIGHYDGSNCTDCHNHDNSFIPPSGP